MYKHYIEIDDNNNIIAAYSSAFKQPSLISITVCEDGSRHFNLDLLEGTIYKYKYTSGEITKKTDDEIQQEIIDSISIDTYKANKKLDVDKLIQAEISKGFIFDGHTFSLSLEAQINWTNVKINKDSLSFPLECTIQDFPYIYNVQEEDVDALVGTAISTVKEILERGRKIKSEFDSLETKQEIISYIPLI